ncbi:MAG: tRNA glutamyl-Q(34) synthetase GluQRS, partial [Burkholderiaceae bacterium]
QYLHTPLVMALDGEKLSKQNGAEALDTSKPLETLNAAAKLLNLTAQADRIDDALQVWTAQWRRLYNITRE